MRLRVASGLLALLLISPMPRAAGADVPVTIGGGSSDSAAQADSSQGTKSSDGSGGKETPENSPVPEPGTLAIVGGGLLALSLLRRRKEEEDKPA